MNLFNKEEILRELPKEIYLGTSNGKYELVNTDCIIAPPQLFIVYHQNTVEKTGDVLSDGEPDYLGFDIQIIQNPKKCKCDVTYGDSMMFSFEMLPTGDVNVGHYDGYGSKFDPEYEFYFDEQTLNNLISFFTKMTNFPLKRNKFNFLDGDKHSFKMEKVNHRRIVDFGRFNPQGRL